MRRLIKIKSHRRNGLISAYANEDPEEEVNDGSWRKTGEGFSQSRGKCIEYTCFYGGTQCVTGQTKTVYQF